MKNFWNDLPRPFFCLAPMEDVTDSVFRALVAEHRNKCRTSDVLHCGPDVFYTEFTSADGLSVAPEKGRDSLLKKLEFGKDEHPIVAQFFTAVPEYMERSAVLAAERGFDGIDINMGCPDRKVEKQGSGAALIKNPKLARELIRATKSGLRKSRIELPISVKTRTGYSKDELNTFLPELLAEDLAAIAIHARTRKEMSDVPAHWDAIARAVKIRNQCQGDTLTRTLIIGNGDVQTLAEGRARVRETGCDGIMIGRAAIANPWLWNEYEPTREERMAMMRRHIDIAEQRGGVFSYGGIRKHLTKYALGFHNAKELRSAISNAKSVEDLNLLIDKII